MEYAVVLLTSIIAAIITSYAITSALANELMKELDEIEKEHRERLLEAGVDAVNRIKSEVELGVVLNRDKP